jgi:hypothetical protein
MGKLLGVPSSFAIYLIIVNLTIQMLSQVMVTIDLVQLSVGIRDNVVQ